MSGLKNKIISRMALLGITPKRSLGQNFLVSDSVVSRILQAADASRFDHVYEVGPGLGALTDSLNEQAKELSVIELDKSFANFWREQNVEVFEVDALRWDWQEIKPNSLLVSNLPYQISSRLVVDRSLQHPGLSRMVLMFQKEVAQRLVAQPSTSNYGLLTVIAQLAWDIDFVCEAGSVDFMPKPNVASRVLSFQRRTGWPTDLDTKSFFSFVKASFANRRKQLLPKLTSYRKKDELLKVFSDVGLSSDTRAEKLSPEQFVELYRHLKSE